MNDITIRPAAVKDQQGFLEMLCEFAAQEQCEPPDEAGKSRLLNDGFGKQRRFEVLVAEVSDQLAGYAIFYEIYSSFLARPKLYVEDLYVRPAFRDCGIGKALFDACAQETASRGFDLMQWYVEGWNENAVAFYQRMGAQRLNRQIWQLVCTVQ